MTLTDPRVDRIRQAVETTGPEALDLLWPEIVAAGTPLISSIDAETSLVTFLWRGQARTTSVRWGVEVELRQLDGTDLWHGSVSLPADLRTVYYLAHDDATDVPDNREFGLTHVDPLNPHPFLFPADEHDPTDADHWASLLELPRAAAEPWLVTPGRTNQGSTVEAVLDSTVLGGPRHVSIHLPAGHEPDGLPLLVVFDGSLSRTVLGVPTTVDNLIAAGRIPPLAVLFVNTPDAVRDDELQPRPPIVDFIADELLPWAKREWGVGSTGTGNTIAGASRGGLAAAYVAFCRPDLFDAVISQSGSFWWRESPEHEPEWLTRQYAAAPLLPLRFYLDVGNRENSPSPGGVGTQLTVNRRMRDTLRDRGYPVAYSEYAGAHDYVNWRRTFADGLLAVLPTPPNARRTLDG